MEAETKLTLVTLSYERRQMSVFIPLPVVDGKVVVDAETFHKICKDHGIELRKGCTFTIVG